MTTKKLLLQIPSQMVSKPIIYTLAKEYDIEVNIYRAKINPDDTGYMVIDIKGSKDKVSETFDYFTQHDIMINEKTNGLTWSKELCTACTACVPHCPTEALSITCREQMKVEFSDEKCIECMNCISHCPFGACSSLF